MQRQWRWHRAARNVGVAVLGAAVLATAVLTVAHRAVLTLAGRNASPQFAAGCASDGYARGALTYREAARPGIGLAAWPTFESAADHNLVLPAGVGSQPLAATWRFRTGAGVGTAPAIVDGIAYIASMDRCVYALDARTGHLLWSFRGDNGFMSEPLVVGGRLFVGSGGKLVYQVNGVWRRGTPPNSVYGLDARTGRRLWRFRTPGENMATQVYAHGTVYAATGDATFYAIDSGSGRLRWKLPVSIDSMSSPAVWHDIAVFGGAKPYELYGVNLRSGRIAWQLPLPAEGGVDDLSVAIANGVAYAQVPEGVYPNATVVEYAVDVATGKNLWQRVLGTGNLPVSDMEETGAATVVDGVVYVGSPALQALWALNAKTGQPVWSAPTALPTGVRASPTVDGGSILAMAQGQMFVVDRTTGALQHTLTLGTPVTGTTFCAWPAPVVAGDTVFYVSGSGDTLSAAPLRDVLAGTLPHG